VQRTLIGGQPRLTHWLLMSTYIQWTNSNTREIVAAAFDSQQCTTHTDTDTHICMQTMHARRRLAVRWKGASNRKRKHARLGTHERIGQGADGVATAAVSGTASTGDK
jgi:hypothetical protein